MGLLQKKQVPLSNTRMVTKLMMDITRGMEELSRRGIIHRDLALRNILVDEDWNCKIAGNRIFVLIIQISD